MNKAKKLEAIKARKKTATKPLRAHELFVNRPIKERHRFFDGHGTEFFTADCTVTLVEVDETHDLEFNDPMLPEIPSALFKVSGQVPFQPTFEVDEETWPPIGYMPDNVVSLTVDSENITPEFADALMGKFPQSEDVALACEYLGCEIKVVPGPEGLVHQLEDGAWVDHKPAIGWRPFGYPSSDTAKGEKLDWDLPEGETRITNATTGASKGSKAARFDLIPVPALTELAELYGFGVKKYAARNWEGGYDLSLSYAALQRHANAWWGGEDTDEETTLSHMAAVAWHAFTLMTLLKTHPEMDDRPTTVHDPLEGFDPEYNKIAVNWITGRSGM